MNRPSDAASLARRDPEPVASAAAEPVALDVERLADLVLAALTEWTGEPSDGVSAAIRRAIASKAAAEYAVEEGS